ncbi:response regulator [Herbivorax sp. ANBcel31]|uniref:response regulator n=1 Tax=Herbivorax sp. ANBcel31 TaxID=3069754 RepID=UPI0027B26A47|nr:response regulator [Herbivorax sp. ANBcel31]MDQ2085522.1 response regulator [Herbivorax sp. ANBcel31]
MFCVMVVEDDLILREWFKSQIKWEEYGFKLVCVANNGIDALQKLNQHDIDLVISEISMPKMDGIELLNTIKEYDKSSMLIYLSENEDFSYAKQGLLLGAYDYILKPLESDKLINVLKKAYEILKKRHLERDKNQILKEKLEMNLSISREKILYDLLRGKESFYKLNGLVEEYNINISDKIVLIGIIEIGSFDASSKELIKSGEFGELIKKIREIIHIVVKGFDNLVCNTIDMDIGIIGVVLQPCNEIKDKEFEDLSNDFYETVAEEIKRNHNVRVTVGIGSVVSSLDEISLSYMAAKSALRHKYILGGNRVINISQFDQNGNKSLLYPVEREKLLAEYIMAGNDKALKLAENIFDDIETGNQDNLKRIAFTAGQLIFNISHFIDIHYGFINKLYDFSVFVNINMSDFDTKDEIKVYFIKFVTSVLEVVKEYKPAQSNALIKKACEYVLGHIEQDITLLSIAEYLNISKNYFCSLFKQETGYNFLEYVTKIKMEWAKMLLKEGSYKTYEVSEMLGYREASYFSRLFRKYTDQSPAEYKKSFQNQK